MKFAGNLKPEAILATEPQLRLIVFLGVLVVMAVWELAAPRRRREIPWVMRWKNNLGLMVIDTIVLRQSFPILAVGLAVIAQDRGWGLFNIIEGSGWVAVLVSIIFLGLVIYLQHVMFHAVPALWRLHLKETGLQTCFASADPVTVRRASAE